jgi:16S rRNA (uracil1498-N3)-methyltransferase
MQLYYHPDLSNTLFDLTEEESAHLKVLRLQPEDQIHVTDGQGTLALVAIAQNKRKQWSVRIIERKSYDASKLGLELAISPLKNSERIEWLMEKATEMGIKTFTVVPCTRTERKAVNEDRLRKVMISAAKQSQHFHFPELRIMKSFSEFINEPFSGEQFIAFCGEHTKPIQEQLTPHLPARILIGPEGDFTNDEVAMAIAKGYSSVSLGESRLRSETAGLFAVALFKFLNRL